MIRIENLSKKQATPPIQPTQEETQVRASSSVAKLKKTLKPVKTGDAWLDSILDDWHGFSFESVNWILDKFKRPNKDKK